MYLWFLRAWLIGLFFFGLIICDEDKQEKEAPNNGNKKVDEKTPEESKTVSTKEEKKEDVKSGDKENGDKSVGKEKYQKAEEVKAESVPAYTNIFKLDADFGISVAPRNAECYYLDYKKGVTLYLSFEVINGGDRLIDVYVRDETTKESLIPPIIDATSEFKEHEFKKDALIRVCFVNYKSSISTKTIRISIYNTVFRQHTEEEIKTQTALAMVSHFSERFEKIYMNFANMTMSSKASMRHAFKDFMKMRQNQKHVQYWAILHVVLIIGSSMLQVFFVRHFFREPVQRKNRV